LCMSAVKILSLNVTNQDKLLMPLNDSNSFGDDPKINGQNRRHSAISKVFK